MLHAACCTRCLYIQTANTVKSGQGGRQRWGWGWGIKPTLANRMQQLSAAGVRAGAGRSVFRKDYLPMQPDITRNTLALPLQMDGWVVPPVHLRPATPRPSHEWLEWAAACPTGRAGPARSGSLRQGLNLSQRTSAAQELVAHDCARCFPCDPWPAVTLPDPGDPCRDLCEAVSVSLSILLIKVLNDAPKFAVRVESGRAVPYAHWHVTSERVGRGGEEGR